ncbi:MAG: chemotaxis protein CheD [Candidatus Omnitrophica bacterium]|nr:chemotaxis protein CheD [Candidatus Omnitrophota bacterium]
MADIEAKIGDVIITRNSEDHLVALGVGSCIIITLYDLKNKIGAMAHAMLSLRSSGEAVGMKDTRYIDAAVDMMLAKMTSAGSRKENLEAKLIGGSNMFPNIKSSIGEKNIAGAREKLKKEGIEIVGEAVGGTQGRSVEFCVATKIVTVKTKF